MTTPAVGAPADTGAPPEATGTPAPAASPAPAAAPVKLDEQTPTPSPTPTPTPAPADTGGDPAPITYDPTGDTALDVALSFVGKLGISMEHPAMQATATGDFSLIKAHLATMGDKAAGWEQMVALAEGSYTRTSEAQAATATAVATAVHAVAGSPEAWAEVKAWASTKATPEEKADLNAMFDAGPRQARAAAMMIMEAYSKATGTVTKPASAVKQGTAGVGNNSTGKLSARDYHGEVRALRGKFANDVSMAQSPEYAALRQRLAR